MLSRFVCAVWLFVAPLCAIAGCGDPGTFDVATVVKEDGSCERSIYQPRDQHLPKEARAAKDAEAAQPRLADDWIARWQTVVGATKPPEKRTTDAPLDKQPYFRATGTFASPADIPSHYRYAAEHVPQASASVLARDFRRVDLGLLVEYRWEETVTNCVTLERFLVARDKALDLGWPMLRRGVHAALSEQYDTQALEEFIDTDLRTFASALAVMVYDHLASRASADELDRRFTALVERYGFTFRDDPTKSLGEDQAAFHDLATQVLARYLKQIDGSPVDFDTAKMLVDSDRLFKDQPLDARERETIERQWNAITPDLCGAYEPIRIFMQDEQFEFSLTLPGTVVETNGLIVATDRSRWRFTAHHTFPSGYHMTARSIVIDRDAQRATLGRVAVDDVETADRVIELVGRDSPLAQAVRKAFAEHDLAVVERLEIDDKDEQARLVELMKLLKP